MMISPSGYRSEHENETYEELMEERDRLIHAIWKFENDEKRGDRSGKEWEIQPSPDVIYQCNLSYLAEICGLVEEKFNDKLWEDDDDDDEED